MKKKIFCMILALVMVVSLMAGLSMTASATDDDWLPTITFDPNGGTGKMDSHSQGGETYPLPECGFTAPEGYRFKCWNVTGKGEMAPGERVYMGGNLEAKAIWEPIPAKLTFDAAAPAKWPRLSSLATTPCPSAASLPRKVSSLPPGSWAIRLCSPARMSTSMIF